MRNDAEIVKEVIVQVSKIPMKDILEDMNMLKWQDVKPMLKISRSAIYNLAHKGQLPGAKIGGTLRFRPRALYAFILAKERVAIAEAA